MESNETGFVDAGNLVAVVAGVPALHRDDVLDSTLLGQLAATKKHSRFDRPEEWGKTYHDTIESLGWRIDRFRVKPWRPLTRTFRVETVVLEVLERTATAAELALVASTIATLEALAPTAPPVELFEASSHSLNRVNFEVCAVSQGASGPRMRVVNIAFATEEEIERSLWQDISSLLLVDGQVEATSYIANLDERLYSRSRREIIEKLGDRRAQLIRSLDVTPNSPGGETHAQYPQTIR